MKQASAKSKYVAARVNLQLAERMQRVLAHPRDIAYAPRNVSDIVVRGIELALRELEADRPSK